MPHPNLGWGTRASPKKRYAKQHHNNEILGKTQQAEIIPYLNSLQIRTFWTCFPSTMTSSCLAARLCHICTSDFFEQMSNFCPLVEARTRTPTATQTKSLACVQVPYPKERVMVSDDVLQCT